MSVKEPASYYSKEIFYNTGPVGRILWCPSTNRFYLLCNDAVKRDLVAEISERSGIWISDRDIEGIEKSTAVTEPLSSACKFIWNNGFFKGSRFHLLEKRIPSENLTEDVIRFFEKEHLGKSKEKLADVVLMILDGPEISGELQLELIRKAAQSLNLL
jgi:hypothetical protein